MCDDKVSSLQKTVQSVATKVPKIVIQRAEEIFPALKEIMKDEPGSHIEACASSSEDGDRSVNIKVEEFSDVVDRKDPVPITFEQVKAEHENSMHSQEYVPGSHNVACATSSLDGVQSVNIKVEEFSHVENRKDPVPITFVQVKAEHEDSAHSQEDVPGSYTETCPASSHNAFQTINIKVEEISDVEEEEDPLPISFPVVETECESALNEHQFIHSECPFFCDMCNKSFNHSSGLKRHQRIHDADRSFSCDVCNKSFSRHGHLKEHQRIHSGERPYTCEVCNKSFSRQSYLKAHLHIHSGKRAFSCPVCNKSFTTKDVLTVHKRIHSEERPYSCAMCNKSYVSKNQVKVHLRKHNGERPFSCDMCSKSYTCSNDLKVHQRIHTGERPFSCDTCNKSFIKNCHLKAHQHIHSGDRPFSCDICNKSFISNYRLKAHQRVHIGKRLFSCDVK